MRATATMERDVQSLWDDFIETGSNLSREKLLIHYLPLVKQVAGRIKTGLPGSVEYDDLVSSGLLGLINSIDNFDITMGFKFETYASQRIRGAILDGLRDVDWLPRSIRQKSRKLDTAVSQLTAKLGRIPDDFELAEDLGLKPEEFDEFMNQAGAASLVSLDVLISSSDESDSGSLHEVLPDAEAVDPYEATEQDDVKKTTLKLIDELNEQERAIIALYYYEELTFREIGAVIGVSESRICQIHTKIISTLRVRLEKLLE